jgi:glycosyltransferase involved in cell wall biosynthesis
MSGEEGVLPARIPVAVVMSSLEPGGTEHQMLELIARVDPSRWAVHVVSLREGGPWRDRVPRGVPVVPFPLTSLHKPASLQRLREFASWCRRERIAVVHTVDLPSNVFGQCGAALAGVSVRIANRRDVNPGKTRLELAAQRLAYAGAHRIVANCRAAADRLRVERVPSAKISVIHNGIDVDRFLVRGPKPLLRRVITVANLRAEKGHDVLIDAAAQVLAQFPDARFEIVGGGPLHGQLTTRVNDRHLSHAIAFPGHQEDVAARLDGADLFVLPSRSEAFPNAVLEAMASGLPIVASAVGGVPELITHGRTGLLVPPADASALAQAICTLMADPASAGRMGAAAQRDASTNYSFERMVPQFENVYTSELMRRGLLGRSQPLAAA